MATTARDIIDQAMVKLHWDNVDKEALKLLNAQFGSAVQRGLTGPIAPEPREVPGSEYVRAPAQHQWGACGDRCERCGLVRELVEDFAPDCGDPVDVRDAVIAAMWRALAKATVVVRGGESPSVIEDLQRKVSSLTEQLASVDAMLLRERTNYDLSCVARDQLRSENRLLKEENARLKTELDRHPWARRMK